MRGGKRGRATKQRGNIAIYPRTRLIYNDAYSHYAARCLGAPLICTTYFLSFALAEFTEKKGKKREGGGRRKKRKIRVEEKEERASREWRMNYSTGSSHLPRR